jgi:hypothetical protein
LGQPLTSANVLNISVTGKGTSTRSRPGGNVYERRNGLHLSNNGPNRFGKTNSIPLSNISIRRYVTWDEIFGDRFEGPDEKIYDEIDSGEFVNEWQSPLTRLKLKLIRFFAMWQSINKIERNVLKI